MNPAASLSGRESRSFRAGSVKSSSASSPPPTPRFADDLLLRLPHATEALFRDWLAEHRPDRAGRVLALLRELGGGKVDDPTWGLRMRGRGPLADLLARRFVLRCRLVGLEARAPALATRHVAPPGQLAMF